MLSKNLTFGIVFLSQTGVGILGNALVLVVSLSSFTQPSQRRATDKILTHLTFANLLTITFRGIPEIMFSFGIKHMLDDVGCKIVMYIYSVNRGVSIGTTCLLSTIQAIIISPNNGRWAWLKLRATSFICPSFSFFWALNMIINIHVITESTATKNYTSGQRGFFMKYCTTPGVNITLITCLFIRDLFFLFFMMLASVYTVILLCRHQKILQEIHKGKHIQKCSPETKAMQTVLCLVICFVLFYSLNSFFIILTASSNEKNSNIPEFSVLFALCYPILCPFLFINIDNRISRAFHVLRKLDNSQL